MKFVDPAGATEINPDVLQGLIPNLTTQAELNEYEALAAAEGSSIAVKIPPQNNRGGISEYSM